eukprot:Skav216496  [mRNA]  locus=scaffold1123:546730:551630:- [translate_table: standard]
MPGPLAVYAESQEEPVRCHPAANLQSSNVLNPAWPWLQPLRMHKAISVPVRTVRLQLLDQGLQQFAGGQRHQTDLPLPELASPPVDPGERKMLRRNCLR